ncbi:MAG: hypothetical protein WDO18_17650 [Acidobacteriota bacterium]
MPPLFEGGAVAPSSLVRIRGWRFGVTATAPAGAPLPKELAGIAVEFATPA